MGMYDTINGEQVKCFPWVSLYHGEITYHGGDLKYYGKGSEVPFRRPHYNYGKNFIILDYNRFPESKYADYQYYLHIIEDGKVKKTIKDKLIKSLDWSSYPVVVGYYGELLNIHSNQDVLDFISAQLTYFEKRESIRSYWNELFKEQMKYFNGIALLDKDSEERNFRNKKIEEIHQLMETEEYRIKSELDVLDSENQCWFVDTSSFEDCITLGDFISASKIKSEESEACEEKIKELLSSDDTLYARYVAWQGSDDFIEEFSTEKQENKLCLQ